MLKRSHGPDLSLQKLSPPSTTALSCLVPGGRLSVVLKAEDIPELLLTPSSAALTKVDAASVMPREKFDCVYLF